MKFIVFLALCFVAWWLFSNTTINGQAFNINDLLSQNNSATGLQKNLFDILKPIAQTTPPPQSTAAIFSAINEFPQMRQSGHDIQTATSNYTCPINENLRGYEYAPTQQLNDQYSICYAGCRYKPSDVTSEFSHYVTQFKSETDNGTQLPIYKIDGAWLWTGVTC